MSYLDLIYIKKGGVGFLTLMCDNHVIPTGFFTRMTSFC